MNLQAAISRANVIYWESVWRRSSEIEADPIIYWKAALFKRIWRDYFEKDHKER